MSFLGVIGRLPEVHLLLEAHARVQVHLLVIDRHFNVPDHHVSPAAILDVETVVEVFVRERDVDGRRGVRPRLCPAMRLRFGAGWENGQNGPGKQGEKGKTKRLLKSHQSTTLSSAVTTTRKAQLSWTKFSISSFERWRF